ncbi:hypothetical protein [Natronorubrum sulfidifaciens]|uniref:Uncharacterized protein n=1 Tax=Natronorubrum sulfidifaciens JCM 14089 TaxID=1230460 RepID=L9W2P8_9EURY|nr:hypothetical protein [Natronorubrum sulfidifaciens]ELY42593.1 hypothetical protein C495_14807 [Natronorubrum sulfidifaciens JCM 14089]
MKNASTVTTVVDALVEVANGRTRSGLLLLGAAAASTRIPGLGTAASVVLRVARRGR